MGKHERTLTFVNVAHTILTQHHLMTVRQVYYQLVSRQVIENRKSQYNPRVGTAFLFGG